MCNKSDHEEEVLEEFLRCLDDPKLIPFSIESKTPNEPDILVKFTESEEYFELARILDRRLMNLRLGALRYAPKYVKMNPSRFGLPEREILIAKLRKEYTTFSKPVNLLLYYDVGIYYGAVPPINLSKYFNHELKPLLESNPRFKNVFVYDRMTRHILWKY